MLLFFFKSDTFSKMASIFRPFVKMSPCMTVMSLIITSLILRPLTSIFRPLSSNFCLISSSVGGLRVDGLHRIRGFSLQGFGPHLHHFALQQLVIPFIDLIFVTPFFICLIPFIDLGFVIVSAMRSAKRTTRKILMVACFFLEIKVLRSPRFLRLLRDWHCQWQNVKFFLKRYKQP